MQANILPVLLALVWFINSDPFKISNQKTKINNLWWPGLVVGGISIVLLTIFTFILPAQAITYANRATESLYSGKYWQAENLFKKALSLNSWISNPIRLHTAVLGSIEGISKTSEWSKFQVVAAENMHNYIKERPRHAYGWLTSGMYFGSLADIDDIYTRKAEKSFEMTTSLLPNTAEPWFRWGEMYVHLGMTLEAQEKFNQALVLEPNNWIVLFDVGAFEINNGNVAVGADKILKSYSLGYCTLFKNVDTKILNIDGAATEILISSYQRILDCDRARHRQDEVYAIVNLSLLYKEQGDLEKALDTAKLIGKYNIKFQELTRFKKDLGLEW